MESGLRNLCPHVLLPLRSPSISRSITSPSITASIQCTGLTNLKLPSPHRIDFGKCRERVIFLSISGRRSLTGLPSFSITATAYSPFPFFSIFRLSTSTPWEDAKPMAALVGAPFSSKVIFLGGPKTTFLTVDCL